MSSVSSEFNRLEIKSNESISPEPISSAIPNYSPMNFNEDGVVALSRKIVENFRGGNSASSLSEDLARIKESISSIQKQDNLNSIHLNMKIFDQEYRKPRPRPKDSLQIQLATEEILFQLAARKIEITQNAGPVSLSIQSELIPRLDETACLAHENSPSRDDISSINLEIASLQERLDALREDLLMKIHEQSERIEGMIRQGEPRDFLEDFKISLMDCLESGTHVESLFYRLKKLNWEENKENIAEIIKQCFSLKFLPHWRKFLEHLKNASEQDREKAIFMIDRTISLLNEKNLVAMDNSRSIYRDKLTQGDNTLMPGKMKVSNWLAYRLSFEEDGNLVILDDKGNRTWESKTTKGTRLEWEKDPETEMPTGNLLLYGQGKEVIWSTRTGGSARSKEGNYLIIGDDGKLKMFEHGDEEGKTLLWSSDPVDKVYKVSIKVFHRTSEKKEQYPEAEIYYGNGIDEDYAIIGGGAEDHWEGRGNLLFASIPILDQGRVIGWRARGKDHAVRSDAKITAYAIGMRLKRNNNTNVEISTECFQQENVSLDDQVSSASISKDPNEVFVTGGGAEVSWNKGGAGILLTTNMPITDENGRVTGWKAEGKDHNERCIGKITAYAIGITRNPFDFVPTAIISTSISSEEAENPEISTEKNCALSGGVKIGGGAKNVWKEGESGNLLTMSAPTLEGNHLTGWKAKGKSHLYRSKAQVFVYEMSMVLDGGFVIEETTPEGEGEVEVG